MGYLNTKEITIEAVLTKAGREKIANGQPLGITRFALADDEVDYNLWRSDHPNGSEFAKDVISNLPLMEAFVDETQVMRHKLVSLPRKTDKMPVITVPTTQITLQAGDQAVINPTTKNGSNEQLGYTAILHNSEYAYVGVAAGGAVSTTTGTIPIFLSEEDSVRTQTAIGRKFVVTGKTIRNVGSSTYASTKLTIIGNETGGTVLVDIDVKPVS